MSTFDESVLREVLGFYALYASALSMGCMWIWSYEL